MAAYPSWQRYGAALVVGVAIVCTGVIALGFLVPEQLFDSGLGLAVFFAAGILMIACAVLANLYDLRGMLAGAFR